MPHDKDLVEAVAVGLYETGSACGCTDYDLRVLARYALDLAERAADASVTAYRLNDAPGNDGVLARAVRRAVADEGGKA